jgi:hypothetical protein
MVYIFLNYGVTKGGIKLFEKSDNSPQNQQKRSSSKPKDDDESVFSFDNDKLLQSENLT